jgi:hypothetical protein
MRKMLIKIVIVVALAVTMSILWIFGGRQLSLFVDRFKTIEAASTPIKSLAYEGSGTAGTLHIDELGLSLDWADSHTEPVHVGTNKDGQLALSFGGKVFAFGPPQSEPENLATAPPAGDEASIATQHSMLSWPTLFDFNFMTGRSPSWKRHQYHQLTWRKQNGRKLEVLWRYEQYFYPGDGWASGLMTREGFTGLIRVEISDASR